MQLAVIPAKAGIQSFCGFLDSRIRGNDKKEDFAAVLRRYRRKMKLFFSRGKVEDALLQARGEILNGLITIRP